MLLRCLPPEERVRPLRRPSAARLTPWCLLGLLTGGLLSGCGTTLKEIRHHPQQARLEQILATILPQTKHPERHYWIRVAEPTEHPIGLAVLPQRHIYVCASLMDEADEAILTALVAHGVAHHQLRHHRHRGVLLAIQQIAFKVGGFFVPGLSQGHYVGGPLAEVALSAGQEPKADAQTVTYLTRMGYAAEDLRRALEFLVEHEYAERVGRVTLRGRELTNRISALRHADPP